MQISVEFDRFSVCFLTFPIALKEEKREKNVFLMFCFIKKYPDSDEKQQLKKAP